MQLCGDNECNVNELDEGDVVDVVCVGGGGRYLLGIRVGAAVVVC